MNMVVGLPTVALCCSGGWVIGGTINLQGVRLSRGGRLLCAGNGRAITEGGEVGPSGHRGAPSSFEFWQLPIGVYLVLEPT